MTKDPLGGLSLAGYATALRRAQVSATSVVEHYLANIGELDPDLGAYVDVYRDGAFEAAKAVDECLRRGVDLGPLMGLPVAIKDIFAIEGTRTRAGSSIACEDLIGKEGSFVARLRRAGCIVLGKTRTTEFAYSPSGINQTAGTSKNPYDPQDARIPGGSSSGSAVAVAARLCAFSVGSDTGGSVRVPAALNGIVGLKTTAGLWPTDGVFSLSTTLDSIGLFARSVEDVAYLFTALEGGQTEIPEPNQARLAVEKEYFFADLDEPVAAAVERALGAIGRGGVNLTEVALPEAAERAPMSSEIMATELLASFGRERLLSQIEKVDGAVQARIKQFADVRADRYVRLIRRHRQLTQIAGDRLRFSDAWLSPAVACVAQRLADLETIEAQTAMNWRLTKNSQPINVFGQCAISIPIPVDGIPIGLQVACAPGEERKLIGIAAMIENILGRQAPPPQVVTGD